MIPNNLEFLQGVVRQNIKVDVNEFLLKNSAKLEKKDLHWVGKQILSRQKCKIKLPSWFDNFDLILPPPLSIEQSSSFKTAQYKANLFSGNSFADLTGGMGIDCLALSKNFKKGIYFELQNQVAAVAEYNFEKLGVNSIEVLNVNSVEYLNQNNPKFDLIFIDPARRDENQKKVFQLSDCEPNLIENLGLLLKSSDKILIKASPLLDLSLSIKQLKFIEKIHLLAVENETKEILIEISKGFNSPIQVFTVNFTKSNEQKFDFIFKNEASVPVLFSEPMNYLFEPNAAIMKSGGFKSVAQKLELKKISIHSHLYTSNEYVEFPGRVFKVENCTKVDTKSIKMLIPSGKANLTTRNFPMKVEELRKKLKLEDGGEDYIFATTDSKNNKLLIICRKLI